MNPDINASLVIMGVAGCGKSSLGAALAERLGFELIEGDDHHSPGNRDKMRQGIALTDADRAGWLATLAGLLASGGVAAWVGGAPVLRGAWRVGFWGAMAMAAAALVGRLFHVSV